jgi:acyl-CoA thioesterase
VSFIDDANVTALDPTTYTATLAPEWRSMLDIHGGYVAAIAARAIELALDDPERALRSHTTQFIRPAHAGPITIHLDRTHTGRTTAFVRLLVTQDNRPILQSTAIAATNRPGLQFNELTVPPAATTPPPRDAERFVGPEPGLHFAQLDVRFKPGLRLFGAHPRAHVAGWISPIDPTEAITLPWLICAADVMPPSMNFRTDQAVQAATINMDVQLTNPTPAAALAAGQPLYADINCAVSADGYCTEDAAFWAPNGQLLATARQVRLAGA